MLISRCGGPPPPSTHRGRSPSIASPPDLDRIESRRPRQRHGVSYGHRSRPPHADDDLRDPNHAAHRRVSVFETPRPSTVRTIARSGDRGTVAATPQRWNG